MWEVYSKKKETEKKKNNPTAVRVLHSRYFFWFAKKISEVSLCGRGMGIFWEKPFKVKASEKKNKKEILGFQDPLYLRQGLCVLKMKQ